VFDGPRLALKDDRDGVRIREGETVSLLPSDRVALWTGSQLVMAGRARIVNEGDSGCFVLRTVPGNCQGWGQGGQPLELGEIPVDNHGQLGIMVVPMEETLVELKLERR